MQGARARREPTGGQAVQDRGRYLTTVSSAVYDDVLVTRSHRGGRQRDLPESITPPGLTKQSTGRQERSGSWMAIYPLSPPPDLDCSTLSSSLQPLSLSNLNHSQNRPHREPQHRRPPSSQLFPKVNRSPSRLVVSSLLIRTSRCHRTTTLSALPSHQA